MAEFLYLYAICYQTKRGEFINTEFSARNELECALWFVYEFADELDGEQVDYNRMMIELIGCTINGNDLRF